MYIYIYDCVLINFDVVSTAKHAAEDPLREEEHVAAIPTMWTNALGK